MGTNDFFRVLLITVTSCLLYCCTSPPANIPLSSLHPMNKEFSPDGLINVLRERAKKITTIKSTLSMVIKNQGLEQPKKLNGFIAISKPGKIRFKGFTFLGLELFDLVIRDDDFQLFLPNKNVLYRGNREDAYNSPISLPLLPDDITLIFYDDLYESPYLQCWEENDYYLLSLPQGKDDVPGRSKKLWIEKRQLTVVTMEVYNGEELDTRYSFDDYTLIDGSYFPRKVEIERIRDELRVKITINKIELNHTIDSEAFSINTDAIRSIRSWGEGQ